MRQESGTAKNKSKEQYVTTPIDHKLNLENILKDEKNHQLSANQKTEVLTQKPNLFSAALAHKFK